MNQIITLVALVIVGAAGIIALIMGEKDITNLCLGAVVGMVVPTPFTKAGN